MQSCQIGLVDANPSAIDNARKLLSLVLANNDLSNTILKEIETKKKNWWLNVAGTEMKRQDIPEPSWLY